MMMYGSSVGYREHTRARLLGNVSKPDHTVRNELSLALADR